MNIQHWSPLGWTGWISLQSKGLSRVFSNTTVQKHPFFVIEDRLKEPGEWELRRCVTEVWQKREKAMAQEGNKLFRVFSRGTPSCLHGPPSQHPGRSHVIVILYCPEGQGLHFSAVLRRLTHTGSSANIRCFGWCWPQQWQQQWRQWWKYRFLKVGKSPVWRIKGIDSKKSSWSEHLLCLWWSLSVPVCWLLFSLHPYFFSAYTQASGWISSNLIALNSVCQRFPNGRFPKLPSVTLTWVSLCRAQLWKNDLVQGHNINQLESNGTKIDPQSELKQLVTHPEAPWQFQGTVKRPRSGSWPKSWESPPLPPNSWNNPPAH